jgi:hypothetical protein
VDYRGNWGEKVGVAVFDHPASFHHAPQWHVRDYGLLAANPFGRKAFDAELPEASFVLAKGKSIRLRRIKGQAFAWPFMRGESSDS